MNSKNRLVPIFSVGTFPQKGLPLALGLIQAFGRRYAGGGLLKKYRFLPFLNVSLGFMEKIARAFGPGIWLFSHYLWSEQHCLSVSQMVKSIDPRNITIHGGPSVPRYPEACRDFLRQHGHIDFAVLCEGEVAVSEILAVLDGLPESLDEVAEGLQGINGIAFPTRNGAGEREIIRTSYRELVEDLDSIPSPYLSGVFDRLNYSPKFALLETNRGCPYRCAYCCWVGVAGKKIRNFSLERVFAEIEWTAKKKIPILVISDANFGISPRDFEIARHIVHCKERYGYPFYLGINFHAKDADIMAEMVKLWAEAGIFIPGAVTLQTLNPESLRIISRKNISMDQMNQVISKFRKDNLPLRLVLMVGLPGATKRSFKNDLQFCFDRNVSAMTFTTRVLVNSSMGTPEFREKFEIQVDGNNQMQSCFSFSKDDFQYIKELDLIFHVCESYGYLRYVLRFLQWDHGIPALSFMETLLSLNIGTGKEFATLPHMKDPDCFLDLVKNDSGLFYQEISCFAEEHFGMHRDSAFKTALQLNMAVMPHRNRSYPVKLTMDHDFVSYFMDNLQSEPGRRKKLHEYHEREIEINDPELKRSDIKYLNNNNDFKHQIFWEPNDILQEIKLLPLSSPKTK